MPELPLIITVEDAKSPTLLVRVLRAIADQVSSIGTRLETLANSIKLPSMAQIRDALQSSGSYPLNLTNLRGVVADPQPASALRYTAAPTGLVLQSLRDTQFVLVKNGTGYDLCTVIGGSPNSLFTLISGASGGSVMTTNTVQTVTGAKTFNAATLILGGSGGANQVLKQSSAGGAVTVGTLASTNLSDTANIALLNAAQAFSALMTLNGGAQFNALAQFNAEARFTVTSFSGTQTLGGTNFVAPDTSGGACTAKLPAAPATGAWYAIGDYKSNAGTNNITIDGNGKNINGVATKLISTNGGTARVVYLGSEWMMW